MVNFPITIIKEGNTEILVPDLEAYRTSPSSYAPSEAPVFYNERMEINRDFALLSYRIYQESYYDRESSIRFCEPMAGSGIRAVRVANELQNVEVLINDRNPEAYQLIKENIQHLGIQNKAQALQEDANELLVHHSALGTKFNIIDLDPFGSPARFMDAVAQAIFDTGLIAVTSTDMATMCGVYPKACIRKYAAKPIHSSISHEIAIRIQLGFIAKNLARHGFAIKPVFAHFFQHFIRTYLLVDKGITKAKEAMDQLGYVAHCSNCLNIETNKDLINSLSLSCPLCGEKRAIGGPLWLGPIHDPLFITKLFEELETTKHRYGTKKEMLKILSLIKEETKTQSSIKANVGYYDIHEIADKINTPCSKTSETIESLREKGYLAHRTHFCLNGIKTDASIAIIKEIVKDLVKHQIQDSSKKQK